MKPALSIIGLGKLGACLAVSLADKGFRVIGFDHNPRVVKSLNEMKPQIYEPNFEDAIRKNGDHLYFVNDLSKAIDQSTITFIVVPTPSNAKGDYSLNSVLAVCKEMGVLLSKKKAWHLVVLTSTVMPQAIKRKIIPTLEKYSRKLCGVNFSFCYNPEFVALGSVIKDFLNPDFVLIGESDHKAGSLLEEIYRKVCDNKPQIVRTNFSNAELVKLALNTFVTMKITFSNTIARLCEKIPGSNVDIVTSTLGLDRRIGKKYLKGALGYGGPCFPRDVVAFSVLTKSLGVNPLLSQAIDKINKEQIHYLFRLIQSKLIKNGTVGVLGLAYKPNTSVVDQSQGILLSQLLARHKIPVVVFDPVALKNGRSVLSNHRVRYATSAEKCIREADVIVVTTPWELFKNIEPEKIKCRNTPRVLIDCWRLLDQKKFENSGISYIPLGLPL